MRSTPTRLPHATAATLLGQPAPLIQPVHGAASFQGPMISLLSQRLQMASRGRMVHR
jgi:hypothetical protein